ADVRQRVEHVRVGFGNRVVVSRKLGEILLERPYGVFGEVSRERREEGVERRLRAFEISGHRRPRALSLICAKRGSYQHASFVVSVCADLFRRAMVVTDWHAFVDETSTTRASEPAVTRGARKRIPRRT